MANSASSSVKTEMFDEIDNRDVDIDGKDDKFNRYTPQHPLPEELKKLARDDTICKYCGVSYLIHNEIKALEEKLKKAEKELSVLRGQKEREEQLKRENSTLKSKKQKLQSNLDINTAKIQSLNEEIDKLKVDESLNKESADRYKKKYMDTLRQFSKLSQVVRQQKESLAHLKDKTSQWNQEMCGAISEALTHVMELDKATKKETSDYESRIQCIDMEKVVLTESNKQLTNKLKLKENELQAKLEELSSLHSQKDKLEENMLDSMSLQNELKKAQESLKDLAKTEENLKENRDKCNNLTAEVEQFKIKLRTKGEEITDLAKQQSQLKQDHEVALQKLKLELQSKEGELSTCLRSLKNLENEIRDQKHKEQKINCEHNSNMNELLALKESLERARADKEALKSERELMIQAHQNRIEDLRESFKKKMSQIDDWPQKLQAAVAAEKSRHQSELKALEDDLKHNFVLELQIEKDKYNELMKKFQSQEKEKENSRDNKLVQMEQQYKQEINDLRRQEVDMKNRFKEREEELNSEIVNLKTIISNLQDRCAKLDVVDIEKISRLQKELSTAQQHLVDNKDQRKSLEEKLKQAKSKNDFLQGIVEKECEERFDLTEALSKARKDLMSIKMSSGGANNNQKRSSLVGNISSPAIPLQDDALLKSRSQMPTNNINLNYSNMSSNNSSRNNSSENRKSKETQIMESRKRIANMLGRFS